MRRLRLRVAHSRETLHPMHAFEMHRDDFHGSELLHWNASLGETNALVFRVRGDPDAYRAALAERSEAVAYSVTPAVDGVFYCCVRERLTDRDRTYVDAVARGTVVVVPPVGYNGDGTVDVSLVGSSSDLSAVLNALPGDVDVEVLSVGDYGAHATASGALTARQREAVEAAVDRGYYDSPRRATVTDVADDLGVSPSTAAEHLRKAEKGVMARVADRV